MKSKIISLLVLGSIFIGGVQANAETIDNSSNSKAVSTASGYKYNRHYGILIIKINHLLVMMHH